MSPPVGVPRGGVVVGRRSYTIPDSVLSRWQFNEGSGTTAADSEGDNDGAINGATYTTDSKEGSHALSFDGNNDNVIVPDNLGEFGGTASIFLWAKTTDTNNTYRVIGFGQTIPAMYLRFETDGTVTFAAHGPSGYQEVNANPGDPTVYHSYAIAAEGGSQVEAYIDGSPVGTASLGGTSSIGDDNRIGEARNGTQDTSGTVDDVHWYDERLSDQQVSDLHDLNA